MTNIEKSAVKVLVRIILFLIYYVGLIVLGGFLLYFTYLASIWFWSEVIPEISNGRILLFCVVVWAGACCLSIMFAVFLIKPLFSFTKNENGERLEITREECPNLFDIIEDIVKTVGTKMPKHVYLTTQVNACVFYDKSIWAIFFPVHKNLEVGLGLLEGMSEMEFKSVLAHEFGHFAQDSMKVGSTVYVVNSIIYNLVNGHDSWDELMEKWTNSDWGIFSFFGGLTASMANLVNRINLIVYKHIAINSSELSRFMEYDADRVACNCVGSENVISAFNKIEMLSSTDARFREFIHAYAENEECRIDDFYSARDSFIRRFPKYKISFDYTSLLIEAKQQTGNFEKHLRVVNLLDSHPSTDDRIAHARQLNIETPSSTPSPACDIFSQKIKDEVAKKQINYYLNIYIGKKTVNSIEFESHLRDIYDAPEIFRVLFERSFTYFDLEEAKGLQVNETPFNSYNETLIKQYAYSSNEFRMMNELMSMEDTSHLEVYYDEERYDTTSLPVDRQEKIVYGLAEKLKDIDKLVFSYVYKKSDEDIKAELQRLYDDKWYVEFLLSNNDKSAFAQLKNERQDFYNELVSHPNPDEESFTIMHVAYIRFGRLLQEFINSMDVNVLFVALSEEDIEGWRSWSLNPGANIDGEQVNQMFQMIDALEQILRNIALKLASRIEQIAEMVCKERK